MSRRTDAVTIIKGEVFRSRSAILSKTDGKLFKDFTGISHETLVANWRKGGIMTACNGFVSWYAGRMGITGKGGAEIASWFKLEASLRAVGKSHAWVPADGSSEPQRGDILHHSKGGTGLHVDVAMGFTPDKCLIRAAAGQTQFKSPRNPDAETDVLTIVTGQSRYDYKKLLGWLDLERFFDSPPGPETKPSVNWALGWWDVNDGLQYYYYFAADGKVVYTKDRPATLFGPPRVAANQGRYYFNTPTELFIRWKAWDADPTEETFTTTGIRTTMAGTSNRYAALRAQKLG